MNPVTIGLDLLLAFLLLAALGLGVRLNGRLKALRDSHQSFAKAVGDLDAAATKADRALKGLHAASEEAHDSLLARIETARALVLKLEAAGEAAQKAARAAEVAARSAPPVSSSTPGAAPRRSLSDLIATHTPRDSSPRDSTPLPEMRIDPRAAFDARERRPERAPSAPQPTPRRRPAADEDLFTDAESGVRPGLSGLMRMSLERGR